MAYLRGILSRLHSFFINLRVAHRIFFLFTVLCLLIVIFNSGEGLSETLSVLQSFLVGLAAIIGVAVAAEGLDAWHKQIRGPNEYELAKKIGITALNLRSLLNSADIFSINKPVSNEHYKGYSMARRWQQPKYEKEIYDAMDELQDNLKEAELLWGPEVYVVATPLFNLGLELSNYIGYLKALDQPEPMPGSHEDMRQMYLKKRDPISKDIGDKKNEFNNEVDKESKAILKFIRPYLKNRK